MKAVLEQIEEWGAENAAAGVINHEGVIAGVATKAKSSDGVGDEAGGRPRGPGRRRGGRRRPRRAGRAARSTVRHLLAHASGLPFEGREPISEPGVRRIYSNTGFEVLAEHVQASAEMPFAEYLTRAVFEPLELQCEPAGSAAAGLHGTLLDLLDVGRELLVPTLVAPETLAEATTVAFPGSPASCPSSVGWTRTTGASASRVRDLKSPHWTGSRNSPATFGHYGGAGTFLWVDPDAQLALVCLTDREVVGTDVWIKEAWPRFSDAVLAEAAGEQP